MFLDPDNLTDAAPAEILAEAAKGFLPIDQRFIRALLNRPAETVPALVEFTKHDRVQDNVDLELDLAALFHALHAPEGIPFYIECIRVVPTDIPDDIVEALHALGASVIEPLLALYDEIDEEEGEGIAFILASLHIHDERILRLLLQRLEFDTAEGAFLLGLYGDQSAKPALEEVAASLGPQEAELRKEVEEAISLLENSKPSVREEDEFDIFSLYPEKGELPLGVLSKDQTISLFEHPNAETRSEAVHSFFNQQLDENLIASLLHLAKSDPDVRVRASAWESLTDATDNPDIVAEMLAVLHDSNVSLQERGSVLVGLAPEADRNEVRQAMEEFYQRPEARAKALEAMWRSVHSSFRDYFPRHLDDSDVEVKRSAIWGVGYFGIKSELEKLRRLFDDEELRPDALFAYSLAVPGETSKSRMKSLLNRIDKEVGGLSSHEEELVKVALDERLTLAGKEPYFVHEM